jgi:hypothetical protein
MATTTPHVTWTPTMLAQAESARQHAITELAPYPQYDGKHDDPAWRPCLVRRRIVTRMGLAFEKGEVSIGRETPTVYAATGAGYDVWSVRNGIHTLLKLTDAILLDD